MEKRLLTKQEIERAERRGNSTVPPYGSGAAEHRSAERQAICEDQDAKTREKRDIQWVQFYMKKGMMLKMPPDDYTPSE